MSYRQQQQQQEEREQRLIEALDRFHEKRETEEDLQVIAYETGLINYRPRPDHVA